jgi:hypothetical protein
MIKKINSFLFNIKFEYFFIFIVLLSIVKNGLWYSPATERVLKISQNIFVNPFNHTTNEWLLGSFLGPFLGYITNMNTSLYMFSLMHLIIFISLFFIILKIFVLKDSDVIGRYILLAFFMMPISNILFTWLGYADVFTFLIGISIVVFRTNKLIMIISGLLFGINHFEQGLIIALNVLFFYFVNNPNKQQKIIKNYIFLILSIFIGFLMLQLFFYINEFKISFNRISYIENAGFFRYFRALFSNFFAEFFSFFNIFIFFIIYLYSKIKNKYIFKLFIGGVIINLFITLFTVDQTRVFNILIFPLIVTLLSHTEIVKTVEKRIKKFNFIMSFLFIVSLFIPNYYIWEGKIYASAYPNILQCYKKDFK